MSLKGRAEKAISAFLEQEMAASNQWLEEASEEQRGLFWEKLIHWLSYQDLPPPRAWLELSEEEQEEYWEKVRTKYKRHTLGAWLEAWVEQRYGISLSQEAGDGAEGKTEPAGESFSGNTSGRGY